MVCRLAAFLIIAVFFMASWYAALRRSLIIPAPFTALPNAALHTCDLQQRRKYTQYSPKQSFKKACACISQHNFPALFNSVQRILLHIHNRFRAIHVDATFKMKLQTAKIQVNCSYCGNNIICDKAFCMDKALSLIHI